MVARRDRRRVAAGLINGVVIAYGKVVAFMATLAMLVAARGLAEILAEPAHPGRRLPRLHRAFNADILGVDMLIWIFVLVAVLGWVLLNRTTFGRRTVAIGGNREAARLAGINVKRHTVSLYVLSGLAAGIAGVMILGRTTAGTSTHGTLLRARCDRRGRGRRHAARRRPRNDHRHHLRRADLLDADQRLHAEQPRRRRCRTSRRV